MHPTADMDPLGHLVVVWNGSGTLDGDGVFMQRYSVNTSREVPGGSDSWDPEGEDGFEVSVAAGPAAPAAAQGGFFSKLFG